MATMRTTVVVSLLLLIVGFSVAVANVFPSYIRITQDFSTAPFDGSFADGTGAAIRFYLNQQADSVKLEVIPAGGGAAIYTRTAYKLAGGDNAINWNGVTSSKTPAPAASYRFVVTAYHAGFAAYTELSSTGLSIFTRGLTSIKNPASKWFGFLYSVSRGGYATGLVRHASDGRQWGFKPDSALLTTTGVAMPGAGNNLSFAPTADLEGYVYVIKFDDRRIYRFHVDTLNVALFDSSKRDIRTQGLDVKGTGAAKTLYVTSDTAVWKIPIGTQMFNTAAPQKLVSVGADTGKGLVFWDAKVGQDNSLYVVFRATGAIGTTLAANSRGVMKFNLGTGSLPKTLKDTVWIARMADGDPVALDLWDGPTAGASDDILYMTHDLGSPNTEISGIYAFTNLGAAKPTRSIAWADPDNNTSSARGTAVTDVVGNLTYFENSNEIITVVAPPSGPNNYALTSLDSLKITSPGATYDFVTIAGARIDANNDRRPDRFGDTVRVIGVVNSTNVQTTNFGYFCQDSSAGIHIFRSGLVGAPALRPGYRVAVTGRIEDFRGTTEIIPMNLATNITVLDTGNAIVPIPLTIGQFKANPEKYESRRIQLNVVHPLDFAAAQWPAAAASANLNIWNGIDTLILRLDGDTEVPGMTYPAFPVQLSGIATQFTSSSSKYDDGYQITPFFRADFVPVNSTPVTRFALLEPAKGSRVVLNDTAQTVTFRWKKAIDFNGDAVIYQWLPVGKASVPTLNGAQDTFLVRTGKQLLTYLGTADSVVLRWSVLAKDPTHPAIANDDTATVTLKRGTITGVASEELGIPTEFALDQNFPNPFNPSTTIRFALPTQSQVTLRIYDILGREVVTLMQDVRSAGYHDVVWNGGDRSGLTVASGVYFFRIEANPFGGGPQFVQMKKMIMLK